MSDPLVIADRGEVTALCGEVTDAVTMRDFDRVACLFTPEAVMRWPHIDKEFVGRHEVRYFDSTRLPGAPLTTHH
jgi:hypothetical protein